MDEANEEEVEEQEEQEEQEARKGGGCSNRSPVADEGLEEKEESSLVSNIVAVDDSNAVESHRISSCLSSSERVDDFQTSDAERRRGVAPHSNNIVVDGILDIIVTSAASPLLRRNRR